MLAVLCMVAGLIFVMLKHILYFTYLELEFLIKYSQNTDLSAVSSNPTHACVCINSTPNCNITQYNVTAYLGETFQITCGIL